MKANIFITMCAFERNEKGMSFSMKKGKFIVLEGVDGVGKTTIASKLDFNDEFVHVKRKQVSQINDFVDSQMLKHNKLLWTEDGSMDHLLPTTYWITLQAAWYILLTNFVIEPLLNEGKNVVVDGWYYKLKARLYLQGENMDYVENIFKPLIIPDLVVLLNVEFEKIWKRKKEFRAYEFGKFKDSSTETVKDSFIEYQSNTYKNLEKMAFNNEKWIVVDLKDYTVDESTELIKNIILKNLNKEN